MSRRCASLRSFRLPGGDRVICVLPLFHIFALTAVMLRTLSEGGELLFDVMQHGRMIGTVFEF